MDKKYQVFISSTYEDLKEERDAVVKTVLQMGHLPVGMEMFQASDKSQWETIQRHIQQSDYYIVIVAHRYGSVNPETRISYTQQEFNYAGEQKIPRLAFIIDDKASWQNDRNETGPSVKKKLDAFKKHVKSARIVKFWQDKKDLAYLVQGSLNHEININPRVGWVRATEAASPQVADELARLSRENRELLERLSVQPKDELALLAEVLDTESFWLHLPDDEEKVKKLPLRQLFIAATQATYPFTWAIYESLVQIVSGYEHKATDATTWQMIEEYLEELLRLDVVINTSSDYDFKNWVVNEKGKSLYLRYKHEAVKQL